MFFIWITLFFFFVIIYLSVIKLFNSNINILFLLFLCYLLILVVLILLLYIIIYFQVILQCFFIFLVQLGILNIGWYCNADVLACLLLIVVISVAFCVNIYSFNYMLNDPHLFRFYLFLTLFGLCMVILITSVDFIQLFIGWEGVGLCSFLLISFWSTRLQASKAAIKAMLTNRIGDFGLILGFICLFGINKSLNFSVSFLNSNLFVVSFLGVFDFLNINFLIFFCFFLFLGVVGKSAQIGLHVWLPDAMEGPTPVSALIHAATMVTAGVFLIIRCSIFFEFCPSMLFIITLIGIVTAFFSGSIGLVQNDLKRVIAFSTCSQLGYMVCICGLSGYCISFFHLFNHAFFKAVLFLCAGCLIHILSDEQDLRKMGGLRYIVPYTYIIFLIGSLALLGFPYLSGFYSKDCLLAFACGQYTFSGYLIFWLGSIAAFFTACYSFRMLILIFFLKNNLNFYVFKKIHEISFYLGFPLFCLIIGSLFSGFFFKDILIGFGTDLMYSSIFILYQNSFVIDFEFIPLYLKFLPLLCSSFGVFMIFLYYILIKKNVYFFFNGRLYVYYIFFFLNRKWFFDKIYNEYINQFVFICSYFLFFCKIDRGVVEFLGSYTIFNNIISYSYYLLNVYSSFYFDMLFLFIIFIFVFINFILFFYIYSYILYILIILSLFLFVFIF